LYLFNPVNPAMGQHPFQWSDIPNRNMDLLELVEPRDISRISKGRGAFFLKRLPGHSDIFATHPKVEVILWGFFGD
jgi:hypothetical protein